MPFEPQRGFCTLMKLYHEWYRDDRTLMVVCDDKTMLFTEGKDVLKVNGKDVKLPKPLEFYDSLPMIPMSVFCQITGYKVSRQANHVSIELA